MEAAAPNAFSLFAVCVCAHVVAFSVRAAIKVPFGRFNKSGLLLHVHVWFLSEMLEQNYNGSVVDRAWQQLVFTRCHS